MCDGKALDLMRELIMRDVSGMVGALQLSLDGMRDQMDAYGSAFAPTAQVAALEEALGALQQAGAALIDAEITAEFEAEGADGGDTQDNEEARESTEDAIESVSEAITGTEAAIQEASEDVTPSRLHALHRSIIGHRE